MHVSTLQAIEALKAKKRINYYLTGGSRPVFVGRGIVSGLVLAAWAFLWWRAFWD